MFQQQAERAQGRRDHGAAAQIQRALHALGQALQAGDLASAQKCVRRDSETVMLQQHLQRRLPWADRPAVAKDQRESRGSTRPMFPDGP